MAEPQIVLSQPGTPAPVIPPSAPTPPAAPVLAGLALLVSELNDARARIAKLEAALNSRLPAPFRIVFNGATFDFERDDTGATAPTGI